LGACTLPLRSGFSFGTHRPVVERTVSWKRKSWCSVLLLLLRLLLLRLLLLRLLLLRLLLLRLLLVLMLLLVLLVLLMRRHRLEWLVFMVRHRGRLRHHVILLGRCWRLVAGGDVGHDEWLSVDPHDLLRAGRGHRVHHKRAPWRLRWKRRGVRRRHQLRRLRRRRRRWTWHKWGSLVCIRRWRSRAGGGIRRLLRYVLVRIDEHEIVGCTLERDGRRSDGGENLHRLARWY
jgi:hypothetical protein